MNVLRSRTTSLIQADGSHTIVSEVQILTQPADYLQACVAVLVKELEQVLPLDGSHLSILQQFCADLVKAANQCCAQP